MKIVQALISQFSELPFLSFLDFLKFACLQVCEDFSGPISGVKPFNLQRATNVSTEGADMKEVFAQKPYTGRRFLGIKSKG